MNKYYMKGFKVRFIITLGLVFLLNSSFIYKPPAKLGVFSFTLNNKPYVIEGLTAKLRTVTGGYQQLSLSNDLFTSFFFNNISTRTFLLTETPNKDAVIRYTNPANLLTFYPEKGKINISSLDDATHLVSGDFELEMYQKDQPSKKIKITNGKFINVPIVNK